MKPQLYIKNDKGRYEPYKEPTVVDHCVYRKVGNKYEPIGRLTDDYLTEGVWVAYNNGCTNGKYLRNRYELEKAMKIELVQGCIADRFDIDGKPACDMSVEELKIAFSKVCEYIIQLPQEQPYNLQSALYNLVETFAPYEHSEDACECCGDFVETYTLEINHVSITEEWLTKQGFKREYDCICEYTYYIREIDGYFVEVKIGCSNMGDDYVNCHIDNCDRNSVANADIQYVHQLQNLLNIMNIKFDIKL